MRVHPSLDPLLVDASSLKLHPANPRLGDVSAIVDSIEENGVYRPVYAQRSTGYVLAGNHTFQAMLALRAKRVPVLYLDVDDEQALRILLIDNRSADLGTYDNQQLADLLEGLSESDHGLAGTGYVPDDLAELLDALATADEALQDDFEEEQERAELAGRAFGVFDRELVISTALDHFLVQGYPYRRLPLHQCMQEINALAALPLDRLRLTTLGYAVADTYHPHRLSAQVGTQASPVQAIADPARLRHGLNMISDAGNAITDAAVRTIANFVHGAQACANFRPGFALSLYKRFAPDHARVLDTSTGFGGRLVGFLASSCSSYVGIDPNSTTHASNQMLAADLAADKEVTLINLPAEDVDPDGLGTCDFAFTSPPYFSKEHYSDEPTQSYLRYPFGDAWRKGFLAKMIKLQYELLRPGSRNVINIADVTIASQTYPLVEWTISEALSCGFELEAREDFPLGQKRVPGSGTAREAVEPVLVFRKPEGVIK